jgi:hypothetical protein
MHAGALERGGLCRGGVEPSSEAVSAEGALSPRARRTPLVGASIPRARRTPPEGAPAVPPWRAAGAARVVIVLCVF